MTGWNRILLLACGGLLATSVAGAFKPEWQWPALPKGIAAPVVPADNGMSAVKVALGRRLFYDPALSQNSSMSCADCHQQQRGFTDGQVTHKGVMGDMGIRNVPGLANVAWRAGLTWTEAGLTTLEAQAAVPMTGTKPIEMGMGGRETEIAARLNADPCYRRMFAMAYPGAGQADFGKVTAVLGAFQRTMISFGSPYDRYVAGDKHAITGEAAKGIGQFKSAGCVACHNGVNFTDDKPHYVGTAAPSEIFDPAYGGKPPPPGFEPPPENFRTPSLRNVTVTGPWLHDGSAEAVDAAIRRHAASSLTGIDMPALVAFLDSLTDREFLAAAHLSKPAGGCPVKL